MTHVCVSKSTIIGSDNGLPPGRCQVIIWTNAGMLLIGHLETNLREIFIEIHTFLFKKMHLKTSSAKWRPICLVHLHYQHRNYFNIKCIGLCCMRSYDCDDNKQSIDNGNADNVLLIMTILSLQGGHFFLANTYYNSCPKERYRMRLGLCYTFVVAVLYVISF